MLTEDAEGRTFVLKTVYSNSWNPAGIQGPTGDCDMNPQGPGLFLSHMTVVDMTIN